MSAVHRPNTAGSAPAKVMVELHQVTKAYGATNALVNVSLSINDGEFTTLLGPSGSGKTTCLRIIAGMITPDAGSLRIAGRDVSRVPMHKRNIGMVFQNYSLFPHLSVAQNVAYPLRIRGHKKADAKTAVEDALALVKLADYGNRRPEQLSGGQQQRVALARALVFHPDVLLLDEPLSALDRVLREEMQLELRRIHERTGTTMICVTHDRSEALTMSDRVVVLRGGAIIQDDTPKGIYDEANSRFVAEFLGETNVIPMFAEARDVAAGRMTDEKGRTLTVRNSAQRVSSGTNDVVIRVENIAVTPTSESLSAANWSGVVKDMVFLGDAVRFVVACDPHTLIARVATRAVSPNVVRGSTVHLDLAPDKAMVFRPDTGWAGVNDADGASRSAPTGGQRSVENDAR